VKKHLSLPERPKYFFGIQPLTILPTFCLQPLECWGLSSNWTENRVKSPLAAHGDSSGSPFLFVPIPHLTSFSDFLPVFAQYTVPEALPHRVVAKQAGGP